MSYQPGDKVIIWHRFLSVPDIAVATVKSAAPASITTEERVFFRHRHNLLNVLPFDHKVLARLKLQVELASAEEQRHRERETELYQVWERIIEESHASLGVS